MTSSQPLGSIWVCENCEAKIGSNVVSQADGQEANRRVLRPYEMARIHMDITGHMMRRLLEISEEK
jgi:hypothetical protein